MCTYVNNLSIVKCDLVLHVVVVVVVVVTRPLSRDGGMAEDHGAPEAGQLPRAWTRGRGESPKSERRKESVAGQYRMR